MAIHDNGRNTREMVCRTAALGDSDAVHQEYYYISKYCVQFT